jgi:hypothetical protein
MPPAVNLHNESCIWAAEIDDKSIERHLPPEFPPAKPTVAQTEPKNSLGVGLMPPQSSCRLNH